MIIGETFPTSDGTAVWSPRANFLTLQKDQNSFQEVRNVFTVVPPSPASYFESSDKMSLAIVCVLPPGGQT